MFNRKIYLTFDLEEFDIPKEFGSDIDWEEQISVSEKGLLGLLSILEKHGITATFFTTASFASERPALINWLAIKYEIASHSYWHSSFSDEDLQKSREVLERLSGKKVFGLRMPV